MVKPSLSQLLEKEGVNRYALVVATAKCARDITDEYIREREYAEKCGIKDTDRGASIVNPRYRDERAVQNAIDELYDDEYSIVRSTLPEELRGTVDENESDGESEVADGTSESEQASDEASDTADASEDGETSADSEDADA